ADYVRSRLPGAPAHLGLLVHRRTDGNPLFMVNVIDYLLARGVLGRDGRRWQLSAAELDPHTGVPETLRDMIERQLDRLAPGDRRVLEAHSVARPAFPA